MNYSTNIVINLTQHIATYEQIVDGVVEPSNIAKEKINKYLTFNDLPTLHDLRKRASILTNIAKHECIKYQTNLVMIGGAPYIMGILEEALKLRGMLPVYSFSIKHVIEEIQEDGTIIKRTVFEHIGFIKPYV